ncbi:hypothetical protein MCAP1_000405 [Malassezia caprae]|uniref:Uncharacterized protein n=1 Tax=Malassezia caprae TaxID=1381934 RepID=A0AAF0E4U8_9BASI|nr:hypothetical protein MCAP1_000405 [Malassezia caprae]
MSTAAEFDHTYAADALANQLRYNKHVSDMGQEHDLLPAGVEHFTDAKAVDESDDWHFPTEEERRTLRRVSEKMNWPAFAICICEFAERFSYYGATQVYSNFISKPRPVVHGQLSRTGANHGTDSTSGALGLGTVASQGLTLFNTFWCYVTPLLAGWLADAYLGRFPIICYGTVIAQVGHILLTVSAIPGVIDNQKGAEACFVIALIIMGTGTGVFKASCSVLVAEQIKIKQLTVITLKSGEKVIVDPALTTARTYMWYYEMINLGSLAGQLGMIYAEQNVGYWLAYLLPTLVFFLPFPVLWFGRHYYKSEPPNGSVLTQACGALWLCIKNTLSWNPWTFMRKYGTDEFWSYARPSTFRGAVRPKWMTYDDRWVDQLDRGVKACNIFLLFPLYWLCYNQITNNLIVQAGQMDMGGAPNELVSQLDPIFIIVFVLLFQFVLYPACERYNIPLTPLKRITIGFFLASFAMVWAAVLQHYIYKTSPCGTRVGDKHHYAPDGSKCSLLKNSSSLSMWVSSGSYVLIAFSELFASVTSMEVAMIMAPKNMRSIVMAVGTFTTAVASAIGEAFIGLSQNPNWVINYGLFAGLAFVGGILFWLCFRNIDRNQDYLNMIGQETFEEQVAHGAEPDVSDEKAQVV